MTRERILFVCIGNICRSPIAEAMARSVLGERARVESAGTDAVTGNRATSGAIDAARELGLDIQPHRARAVADLDLDHYDRIVALTPHIAADLRSRFHVPAGRIEELDIADPFGLDLDDYRHCASEIDGCIRRLFE